LGSDFFCIFAAEFGYWQKAHNQKSNAQKC